MFLGEGMWRWREYVYVNIYDIRVQIVVHDLWREGPEGEEGGNYMYVNMTYY